MPNLTRHACVREFERMLINDGAVIEMLVSLPRRRTSAGNNSGVFSCSDRSRWRALAGTQVQK